jgi:hypothetical protein
MTDGILNSCDLFIQTGQGFLAGFISTGFYVDDILLAMVITAFTFISLPIIVCETKVDLTIKMECCLLCRATFFSSAPSKFSFLAGNSSVLLSLV